LCPLWVISDSGVRAKGAWLRCVVAGLCAGLVVSLLGAAPGAWAVSKVSLWYWAAGQQGCLDNR
jgi:hypothetical protein